MKQTLKQLNATKHPLKTRKLNGKRELKLSKNWTKGWHHIRRQTLANENKLAEGHVRTMGIALGIQTCGLGIDPRCQKSKSYFLWLIVTVVKFNYSYLFQEDQLTHLSTNPFNKAKTDKTVDNRLNSWTDMFNKHIVT